MYQPLLAIENLAAVFDTPWGVSHALRGVTFAVERGQIFGVVGESGCGKSMTAQAIMGIVPPLGRITNGRVIFAGQDLLALPEKERAQVRGRRISMIFQNPRQALNPVYPVGQQLLWVMQYNGIGSSKSERKQKARALFDEVGLPREERIFQAYPHQLSGGQQQRVMIAMALATEPELLIADEPTTALDVTIQRQILGLLRQLQRERNLTILLITHNMGVVSTTCDNVAVFYAGRVVESGSVQDIFQRPHHPYTQGLLTTLPHPNQRGAALNVIPGVVPSGRTLLPGCAFASRCRHVMERCQQQPPPMLPLVPASSHQAACFLDGTSPAM